MDIAQAPSGVRETPGKRLHDGLERFFLLRQHTGDACFLARLATLQAWQRQRLYRTHADLVAAPEVAPAVRFLVEDVYGGRDLKPVAADIRRAVSKAEKLLPERVLATSAAVLEAAVLTQELDEALVGVLHDRLDTALDHDAYRQGYRELGLRELREQQLDIIGELGGHIDRYVRSRVIQTTFRMVRRPARAAGFGHLYDFLDHAFTTMRPLPSVERLLREVIARERDVMVQLFA